MFGTLKKTQVVKLFNFVGSELLVYCILHLSVFHHISDAELFCPEGVCLLVSKHNNLFPHNNLLLFSLPDNFFRGLL